MIGPSSQSYSNLGQTYSNPGAGQYRGGGTQGSQGSQGALGGVGAPQQALTSSIAGPLPPPLSTVSNTAYRPVQNPLTSVLIGPPDVPVDGPTQGQNYVSASSASSPSAGSLLNSGSITTGSDAEEMSQSDYQEETNMEPGVQTEKEEYGTGSNNQQTGMLFEVLSCKLQNCSSRSKHQRIERCGQIERFEWSLKHCLFHLVSDNIESVYLLVVMEV